MGDRIAELRALEKAATGGPWVWGWTTDVMERPSLFAGKTDSYLVSGICATGRTNSGYNDAALIAAMRNALPDLLYAMHAACNLAEAVDTFRFAYTGDLGYIVIPDALAQMEDAARIWNAALARLDGGDHG